MGRQQCEGCAFNVVSGNIVSNVDDARFGIGTENYSLNGRNEVIRGSKVGKESNERRGRHDTETRRRGRRQDTETRRRGDTENTVLVAVSPRLTVSASLFHFAVSPRLVVSASLVH